MQRFQLLLNMQSGWLKSDVRPSSHKTATLLSLNEGLTVCYPRHSSSIDILQHFLQHPFACRRIYLILVIFARKVKSREIINKRGETTRNVNKKQKEYEVGHGLQTNICGALLWN